MTGEEEPVREYVHLALRLGRLLPGAVDASGADPALRRAVESGPAPRAADLVRDAGRITRDVEAAGLAPSRRRFLAAQLRAVECTARRLAGQDVPYAEEVRRCFDTAIALGEEDVYRTAHLELDLLLPGRGRLAERLARYRARDAIPPERLAAAVDALSRELQRRVRGAYDLPAGDAVEYRFVDDAPWGAFQQSCGPARSLIRINTGAKPRAGQLALLVAHEAYPGHHTERCLLDGTGWAEHTVHVLNSPQSLVSEGLADLALEAVVGLGWGRWSAEVLAEAGVRTDGDLAERVDDALGRLSRVRQDAALLLHAYRVPPDEVVAFLRRWLLVDEARARQMLRFLAHPTWRAYTTTYVEGAAVVRTFLRGPGPGSTLQRHRSLLGRPVSPSDLRARVRLPETRNRVRSVTMMATDGGCHATNGRPNC